MRRFWRLHWQQRKQITRSSKYNGTGSDSQSSDCGYGVPVLCVRMYCLPLMLAASHTRLVLQLRHRVDANQTVMCVYVCVCVCVCVCLCVCLCVCVAGMAVVCCRSGASEGGLLPSTAEAVDGC